MKEVIVKILKKALKKENLNISEEEIEKAIEIPKDSPKGDFAFPCFFLQEKSKQMPHELALNLRTHIGNPSKEFQDIQIVGPYINFFLDRKSLALELIDSIKKQKDNFGKFAENKQTIMVEFPSPNTNKPLHLGHLRNMAIGESISRISEFNGFKVIRANLNNDRGIHICKSMAAYSKFGKNKTPKDANKKPDHFVGEFYVKFNEKSKQDKNLEILSHRMLQKYEEGDKEVLALWKKMNAWALEGFEKTYEKFGIKHDKEYFESKIFKKGKEIIFDGLKKGLFKQKKDKAIYVNLGKQLGEKILLRQDGTSVYITQDIYLAMLRFNEYKLNRLLYVVGNEQEYHFNVLFEILKRLGFESSEMLKHLSYGMVNLPEGKMKSREGTIVDADDLIEDVQKLVKKELEKRYKLSKKELENRSLKIALSAIKYFLLKVDARKNMLFNPKESVSLEGDTGPYIQYAYARASSILKKIKTRPKIKIENLESSEMSLIKKLSDFPKYVAKAYDSLNPSVISNYSYDLAKTFNEFYHACPVIDSKEKEGFRIKLVSSFRQVLKNALYLLGIDVLEEM